MPQESKSIKAIRLTRNLFESIHGNLGLLKFNIERLKPINGEESEKWEVVCSFYETLGSTRPSRYKVEVNLVDRTATVMKIDEEDSLKQKEKYRFSKESESQIKPPVQSESKTEPETGAQPESESESQSRRESELGEKTEE